jgi:hypothetical protein
MHAPPERVGACINIIDCEEPSVLIMLPVLVFVRRVQQCHEAIYRSCAGEFEVVEACGRPIRTRYHHIRFGGQIHPDDTFVPGNTVTVRLLRPDRSMMLVSQICCDDTPCSRAMT